MRSLAIALPLILAPVPAMAQEVVKEPTGWSIYSENDTYAWFRSSDRFYTNGLRLTMDLPVGTHLWGTNDIAAWVAGPLLPGRLTSETSTWSIGQHMFTPDTIETFADDPFDRPYMGLLYVAVGIQVTPDPFELEEDSRWSHRVEIEGQAGLTGPLSLAGTFQKALHTLRRNRIPKGWPHQVPTRPYVNLFGERTWSYRLRIDREFSFNTSPALEAAVGTIHVYAGARLGLALGWNFPVFPATTLVSTAGTEKSMTAQWYVGGFADWGYRYYWWNGLVELAPQGGSVAGDSISAVRTVSTRRLGVLFGRRPFRLTAFLDIQRSPEFEPGGDRNHVGPTYYGSLQLQYAPRGATPWGCACLAALRREIVENWMIEAYAGVGVSRSASLPRRTGEGIRFSLQRRLGDHLALGAEIEGVLRDGGPPNGDGVHTDGFLTSSQIALFLSPLGSDPISRLRVRVGAGLGKSSLQLTSGGVSRKPETLEGDAYLIGLTLAHPVAARVAVLFDYGYRWIDVDPSVTAATFQVGLRWR